MCARMDELDECTKNREIEELGDGCELGWLNPQRRGRYVGGRINDWQSLRADGELGMR